MMLYVWNSPVLKGDQLKKNMAGVFEWYRIAALRKYG